MNLSELVIPIKAATTTEPRKPMLTAGTVLQNRYLIVRLLGQGGMGAVYEARDQRLGNTIALKETFFTDSEMRNAFEREARLLAMLHHPALPGVSDHFVESHGQFLVMQYIAGEDLQSLLNQRGHAFPPADVLRWADQLLDALEYLHSQQPPVIHRDIKPQNLKLTPRGQIVLLDFGLAKGSVSGMSRLSTGHSVQGYTPAYAPPEQIHGKGTDQRSDIYSLAATLYHLLTGVAPADALTRLVAWPQGEPDPLIRADELNPQVPHRLAAVFQKSMSLNREQRLASASEMRRILTNASGHLEVMDEAPTLVPARDRAPRPAADLRQDQRAEATLMAGSDAPRPTTDAAPQTLIASGTGAQRTLPVTSNPAISHSTAPAQGYATGRQDQPATTKSSAKSIAWVVIILLIIGVGAVVYYNSHSGKPSAARGNGPHIEPDIEAATVPPAPMLGGHREAWVEADKVINGDAYHVVRCRYQTDSPDTRSKLYGIKVLALFHFQDGSRIIDRASNYSTASGQIGVQGESAIVYKDKTTYYDMKLYLPKSAIPAGQGHYAVIDIRGTDGTRLATYKSEPFNSN